MLLYNTYKVPRFFINQKTKVKITIVFGGWWDFKTCWIAVRQAAINYANVYTTRVHHFVKRIWLLELVSKVMFDRRLFIIYNERIKMFTDYISSMLCSDMHIIESYKYIKILQRFPQLCHKVIIIVDFA